MNVALHPAFDAAKAVIFDFDFTLADSSKGVIASVSYALCHMGLPPSTPEEMLDAISLPTREMLAALKGEEYRARGEEFAKLFNEKADEALADGTCLYEDTPELLHTLSRLDIPVAIVSTNHRRRIESVLSRRGLREFAAVIVGGEEVNKHKPDPEGLLLVCQYLGVPAQDCVYIGDNEVDARAASCAEMPFVAVKSGTTSEEVFSTYPHLAILASVSDIVRA